MKKMNLLWSVVVLVLFAGLIFITLNKENNMNEAVAVAKTGNTVAMNYTRRLANGTVFDSNVDPKFGHTEPLAFTLGAGQMIPGFEKGVMGMKVGEKKTLTLAPEDAYGAAGRPPVIPPNATLIFEVELLEIIN